MRAKQSVNDIFAVVFVFREAAGNDEIEDSERVTDKELGDLHGSEHLFPRRLVSQASERVVNVHDCVNERIQEGENPHSRNTSDCHCPQADDRTGMMEGL